MSKIGRKPIDLNNVQLEIKGNVIHYKGKNAAGTYELPDFLKAELNDKQLKIVSSVKKNRNLDINKFWGLHRALIANKLKGASDLFIKKLQINGLGFKAELAGSKIKFSLGFSHKIEKNLPKDVSLEIDKTGQNLTFKSVDKEKLGQICDEIRSLRPPEPYKGTGIKLEEENIIRKAGKTKAA